LETVIFAGQVMTGNSVSVTATMNEQVDIFPAASVAVEVTVVVPGGKRLPDAGLLTTVTPGQLSVAVGEANITVASHSPALFETVIFGGQIMTGNSVSFTVTVNEQVDIFPAASVAVELTVVVPLGKKLPGAWLVTNDITEQLSVAVGVANVTLAPQRPSSFGTIILAGQVITGGSVSFTLILNLQVEIFAAASMAMEVTTVVPTGKKLPGA
jgi:hypothetical protein